MSNNFVKILHKKIIVIYLYEYEIHLLTKNF